MVFAGDAEAVLEELAEAWDTTVPEVLRRAIAIAAFFERQRREGASVLLVRGAGKTIEHVDFVFS